VPTLVFAGHVSAAKGVRELIMACREIVHPDFRLEIVGPVLDDFRAELEALSRVKDDGLWLSISGPLPRREVLARLGAAFALVLPSYTEGFPNVILEAMLNAKPVIATPVGAVPEMLRAGGDAACGICVPVGDVNALREAIQSLLDDPPHACELGRRGRERAGLLYSPEKVYAEYHSIWERFACPGARPN
jgi:glycosyltransferase involved in cell wall biosynthesis